MTSESGIPEERIVVGVDASEGSARALSWAADQAALTGAHIDAVHAWTAPLTGGYPVAGWGAVPPPPDAGGARALHEQLLSEAVAALARSHPAVKVSARLVEGHPAEVLVREAVGTDLLVVGSKGHGTVAGILLGSVSHYCTHHATSPVVVVPHERRTTYLSTPNV